MAVQELKDKYEPREEAKKLSMADRVDRLNRLHKSLPGLTLDSWLEPSHALVDRAVAFAEEQCLGPLELSKCTSRESELRSQKRDQVAFKIEGVIKVSKLQPEAIADVSTDLHVRACVQRRALAFQMAGIATFCTLDKVVSKFFSHMMRPLMSGQRPVTIHQVVEADATLWTLVAQETRGKLLTIGSPLPIDAAVESIQHSPDVSYCLIPRLASTAPPPPRATETEHALSRRKRKRLAKERAKPASDAAAVPPTKGGGKGKQLDLPPNAKTRDAQNRPICFRYNRKGCDHQDADKCQRGYHVCWFCLKQHPGCEHK